MNFLWKLSRNELDIFQRISLKFPSVKAKVLGMRSMARVHALCLFGIVVILAHSVPVEVQNARLWADTGLLSNIRA